MLRPAYDFGKVLYVYTLGFVSSIAQSITKWRRSTDGKTNTSGFSQGSNMSHMSVGHTRSHPEHTDEGQVYQFTATEATPVVRRKKPVHTAEGKAFSASKKYDYSIYKIFLSFIL